MVVTRKCSTKRLKMKITIDDEPVVVDDMEMELRNPSPVSITPVHPAIPTVGHHETLVHLDLMLYGYKNYAIQITNSCTSVDGRLLYGGDIYRMGEVKPFDRFVGPLYFEDILARFKSYVDMGNALLMWASYDQDN
jgi:hypothetical protein